MTEPKMTQQEALAKAQSGAPLTGEEGLAALDALLGTNLTGATALHAAGSPLNRVMKTAFGKKAPTPTRTGDPA